MRSDPADSSVSEQRSTIGECFTALEMAQAEATASREGFQEGVRASLAALEDAPPWVEIGFVQSQGWQLAYDHLKARLLRGASRD
mgnify:CR=1 FL=1